MQILNLIYKLNSLIFVWILKINDCSKVKSPLTIEVNATIKCSKLSEEIK